MSEYVISKIIKGFDVQFSIYPKEIEKWHGVFLNDSDEAIKISWYSCHLEGTLSLQWLPATVTFFSVMYNKLSGTIDLTELPPGLEELYLNNNMFEGVTDFSQLPARLTDLYIGYTQLEGTIFIKKGLSSIIIVRN